ncbi:hypothetical protein [Hydrogenophaga sp. BPS33]|uniref:hypothetical protein n=1 Tax=Hydrogenophaga sp. BPS33 TaxID=2651974 RepID=UPI00131FBEF3|nr:hypothetical protein [Hydrogenophaga sp. BPS33]QHE86781.1 hypothetical protein F9K07_18695 [Hydrogenophaga sp. BPS33]
MTTIHGSTPPTYTPVNESKTPADIEQSNLESKRLVGKLADIRALTSLMVHDRALVASLQKELLSIETELGSSSAGHPLSSERLAEISDRLRHLQAQVLPLDGFSRRPAPEVLELLRKRNEEEPGALLKQEASINPDLRRLDALIERYKEIGIENPDLQALRVKLGGGSNPDAQKTP